MLSALDVAQYLLERRGPMSAMKLQKLVYYCQAWSLVWDERPMFREQIEAWINGPVVRDLYEAHKGQFTVRTIRGGRSSRLDDRARATSDIVLDYYGPRNAQELSDLTHAEQPWRQARSGLDGGQRTEREITHASMSEYYSSLPPDADDGGSSN